MSDYPTHLDDLPPGHWEAVPDYMLEDDEPDDPRDLCEADVANGRVCLNPLDSSGNCRNESHHADIQD